MPLPHSKSIIRNNKVYFFSLGVRFTLRNRNALKKYIQAIFTKEGKKLQLINFVFCTDNGLLKINQQYLKHNFYTDIITFNLSESKAIVAEVYISIDRVRDNAQKLNISYSSELHRVIFHGVLHLCGYNDKTKQGRVIMTKKEDFYLKIYQIPNH